MRQGLQMDRERTNKPVSYIANDNLFDSCFFFLLQQRFRVAYIFSVHIRYDFRTHQSSILVS